MDFIEQRGAHFEKLRYMDKMGIEPLPSEKVLRYDMRDIDLQQQQLIMEKQSRQYSKLKFELGLLENKSNQELYSFRKMEIEMMKKMKADRDRPCYLITINPHSGVDVNHLFNMVLDIRDWKNIDEGVWVIEQRGECADTRGNGIHAHIAITKHSFEHERLITRFENKFKSICKMVDKSYKTTINIKRKTPEHIQETIDEYLNGNKEPEKIAKAEQDVIFREEHNINPTYRIEDLTTDKKSSKTPADGRVSNGGNRSRAGRPKGAKNKKGTKKNKVEVIPEIDVKCENKIIEF